MPPEFALLEVEEEDEEEDEEDDSLVDNEAVEDDEEELSCEVLDVVADCELDEESSSLSESSS